MDHLEQENQSLRDKVATLQERVERQNAMITTLLTAQNKSSILMHTSTSLAQPSTSVMPVATKVVNTPQHIVFEGYLWSTPFGSGEMPRSVVSEVQTPLVQLSTPIPQSGHVIPQATMTYSTPLVHTTQQDRRVDDLREQCNEMKREMKALSGKNLFDKSAHELCLVPNVVIPPKFKVPAFVKYKGNTCPKAHMKRNAGKLPPQPNTKNPLTT